MKREPKQTTEIVRDALNELLTRNGATRDAVVGEMYLGRGVFVARLSRPRIIDGEAVTIPNRTADIFDLMDDWEAGERG